MSRANNVLPPDSYTARRLEHANAQHLHDTTRRVFIGPVPEGWLKSHRKQWYRNYVGSGAKRRPTFTAAHPVVSDAPAEESQHDDAVRNEAQPRPSTLSAEGTALHESEPATSITSLLHGQHVESQRISSVSELRRQDMTDGVEETEQEQRRGQEQEQEDMQSAPEIRPILNIRTDSSRINRVASKLPGGNKVRFTEAGRLQLRARAQRLAARGAFRSSKVKDGQMMKVDKMLVRIDITQTSLREDYDEKASQGVETKTLDKWREFMIVCRRHVEDDAEYALQFYQTRVIAVNEGEKVKKKPKIQILLSVRHARVNLYSALDKTLCVWTMKGMRTTIYYLRAQSTAAAVEWYTFLRGLLGGQRAQTLQVNIPDLSVSLRLDDPFKALEESRTIAEAAEGDDEALIKAVNEERGAAGIIVSRCLEMLKESPEWEDVLKAWAQTDPIGLAWKRYDRLEWVFGAVEQQMYGTIGMQRTHDLELRPKIHYPPSIRQRDGELLEEPTPVEGYLIRLTSQKGKEIKLRRMLYKRLYFTTQSQYLVFLQPAASTPPPYQAPAQDNESNVPSSEEILEHMPLVFEVDPYPLEGNEVSWLDTQGAMSAREVEARDRGAAFEAERNVNMLRVSDGFINLCNVVYVRNFHKGATYADQHLDDGSDVDFHQEGISTRADVVDGDTKEVDEDRVFELVMNNGLVIRLQAYSKTTRNEWRNRLRLLVRYWNQRKKADMDLYKSTREQNLQQLGVDERAEAVIGQFAYKWEVNQSFASPALYNMCGIAECRTIHHSGVLFRKPRKHTTFSRCHVVLSHGHLLIYQDTLRKRTGKKLVHIHHERIASISLEGCYLYSGLLTENDLLYQNQTFDSNAPGRHALPRMYLEDSWTSTDEDAMTTFVVWHAKSNSWFKSSQSVDDVRSQERSTDGSRRARTKTKLTRVSQLGATGRSVVFKARSRAERDHWVLAIQVEIERLAAQNEEVRIIDSEKEN